MPRPLIFDIGCHIGEDAEFYLQKGFNVVAVEANPALCAELTRRFSDQIADGSFILIEKAIAERPGVVEFFVNERASIWGTIRADIAAQNDRFGVAPTKIVVPAITFASLIEEFGVPYYLKIDIEGADLLCLEGLLDVRSRPKFVSHEHNQESLRDIYTEMRLLAELGYKKFQIVDQGLVHEQQPPRSLGEGVYLDYQLKKGSSGLFGKDLPGPWLSRRGAIMKYLQIHMRNRLIGAAKRIPFLGRFAEGLTGSWYDTHATKL